MKKISRVAASLDSHSMISSPQQNYLASSPLRNNSLSVKEISYEETTVPVHYPHRLSLYLQAPNYEISIEDFETLALARLERNFFGYLVLTDLLIYFSFKSC